MNKFIVNNRHWFGRKTNCVFNPYSTNKVNHKSAMRICCTGGQVGWGDFLIHEVIGLTDNYNYFLNIWGALRKAAIKYRPKNLDPDIKATWVHYLSIDRINIYNYMYEHFPFLFHFCDNTKWDCWAVKDMVQQYLTQSKMYSNKKKRSHYLCRNTSGKDDEEAEGESNSSDKVPKETEEHQANDGDDKGPCCEEETQSSKVPPHSESIPTAQSLSTAAPRHLHQAGSSSTVDRDICHADKVVACEAERKEASAGPSKRGRASVLQPTQSIAAKSKKGTCGKGGKGKEPADAQPTVEEEEEQEEERDGGSGRGTRVNNDDEPVRPVTIKINIGKDKNSNKVAPATKTSSTATTLGAVKKTAASTKKAALLSNATSLSENSASTVPVAPVVVSTNKKGNKQPFDDKDKEPEPEPMCKKLQPPMKGVPKEDNAPGKAQVTSTCTMTAVKGPDGCMQVQQA